MSESSKNSSVLGDAFVQAIRQAVRDEIYAAIEKNENPPELFSADQAANRWNVPVSWIRDMARRGELPCIHLGHYVRFKPEDLAHFIEQRRNNRTP